MASDPDSYRQRMNYLAKYASIEDFYYRINTLRPIYYIEVPVIYTILDIIHLKTYNEYDDYLVYVFNDILKNINDPFNMSKMLIPVYKKLDIIKERLINESTLLKNEIAQHISDNYLLVDITKNILIPYIYN